MQGYGRDESAPTPGGVFVGISWLNVDILRSVRWAFRGCSQPFHGIFVTY